MLPEEAILRGQRLTERGAMGWRRSMGSIAVGKAVTFYHAAYTIVVYLPYAFGKRFGRKGHFEARK